MYKGEEILAHGTLHEIAEAMDLEYRYVQWLSAPSIRKRMAKSDNSRILINVEDEKEEEE